MEALPPFHPDPATPPLGGYFIAGVSRKEKRKKIALLTLAKVQMRREKEEKLNQIG